MVRRELPVSPQAYEMTARITEQPPLPNGWALHGKTGTGAPVDARGRQDWDHAYGWFVGWASKGERRVVFVRLVQDEKDQETRAGLRARDAFVQALPALLDAI